jgi:hemerythrin
MIMAESNVLMLGIQAMDAEHRELSRLLDEFQDLVENDGAIERIRQVVQDAIRCGNAHFEHEEQMADKAAYPKMDEEKLNHRNLRLQFTTLAGDMLNFRSRDPVTLRHLAEMRQLLEEHIAGPDKNLAEYLKANGHK